MQVVFILFLLLSLASPSNIVLAHKPETLLELMESTKHNPVLSKLKLPNGKNLLDRDKPQIHGADLKESHSNVIYIVRHGEKYFKDKVGKLSEQGWERAFALAPQMTLDPFFQDSYEDMVIIAADSPDGSNEPSRYIETAIPLAFLHNEQIKAYYTHEEYDELASYLKTLENKRIFIFWEHKHMHNLVRALGFNESEVPYYPTEDFSQIWKITDLETLDFYSQNLMYNDAFNYTKEGILKHSLQVPTEKHYPHGDRYATSYSLEARDQAALTCEQQRTNLLCQDFNIRVLDYDADSYQWVDGYVEGANSLSNISGDNPCHDGKAMVGILNAVIDHHASALADASADDICHLGPVAGAAGATITLSGVGQTLCDEMKDSLLATCPKTGRLGASSYETSFPVMPMVYSSVALGGLALGVWAMRKCVKSGGRRSQYVEIPDSWSLSV